MYLNKLHIFIIAAAFCSMAAALKANSSLVGDNLKDNETVVLQLQTQLNELGFDAGQLESVGLGSVEFLDAWVQARQVLQVFVQ